MAITLPTSSSAPTGTTLSSAGQSHPTTPRRPTQALSSGEARLTSPPSRAASADTSASTSRPLPTPSSPLSQSPAQTGPPAQGNFAAPTPGSTRPAPTSSPQQAGSSSRTYAAPGTDGPSLPTPSPSSRSVLDGGCRRGVTPSLTASVTFVSSAPRRRIPADPPRRRRGRNRRRRSACRQPCHGAGFHNAMLEHYGKERLPLPVRSLPSHEHGARAVPEGDTSASGAANGRDPPPVSSRQE